MLLGKGLIKQEELRATVQEIETRGEKALGVDLVVKAWMDPSFKARLLQNANAAGAELGIAVGMWLPMLLHVNFQHSSREDCSQGEHPSCSGLLCISAAVYGCIELLIPVLLPSCRGTFQQVNCQASGTKAG